MASHWRGGRPINQLNLSLYSRIFMANIITIAPVINNALANSSLASIDSSPWIIKADPNSLVIITCPPSPPLPKGMDRSTRPI